MKIKKIIATCPAGLGNRIKCMVFTMDLCERARYYNPYECYNAYVSWPLNNLCGCKFKELFRPFIKETSKKEICRKDMLNKSWKLIINDKEIDFQYHKISQKEINNFLPYFKNIEPKQDIQDTVWAFMNKYKESFDKGEVIGVHVRKGDHQVSFDGRQHISTEEKFITKIYDLLLINANYKFLLCTEDEETEIKFKDIFGDNVIIHFPKRFRGRDSVNSIKEAFVDMLLLSKCSIILGTFLSTFTEVAWWFGDCKAQIYIVGAEDRIAVDKVLAQLPKKGEGLHKKIWRRIKIWISEGI